MFCFRCHYYGVVQLRVWEAGEGRIQATGEGRIQTAGEAGDARIQTGAGNLDIFREAGEARIQGKGEGRLQAAGKALEDRIQASSPNQDIFGEDRGSINDLKIVENLRPATESLDFLRK